jgi:hypothetical protein
MYLIYDENGKAISVGTVIAEDLNPLWTVLPLDSETVKAYLEDGLINWDAETRSFQPRVDGE